MTGDAPGSYPGERISSLWRRTRINSVFIATVILAAATSLLALTSLVAVVTWRENRRRDREEQQTSRVLELAPKEFATKDDVRGLKDEFGSFKGSLGGVGVLGGLLLVIALWDRIATLTKTNGRDGNRET